MTEPLLRKGHVFAGPDFTGYRLTRDLYLTDGLNSVDFEPIGGAPEPAPYMMMPHWLVQQIRAVR